ncbi:hypothetical protein ACFYQ5_28270 [Streptomyces sp. NPDC005794]|uniref:hypothetical protein n=1 Tax=Streptomyces sp. NPDC005794 TaxID=3364733 RepID=UPI00367D2D09
MIVVLANPLNAYVAYGALMTQPQGVWDENTLTGIEVVSGLLIVLGGQLSRPVDRSWSGRSQNVARMRRP